MQENEIILELPADFSLGRLTVYLEGRSDPEAVVEAKGRVRAPSTAKLFLDLSQEICDDLRRLHLVPNTLLANGVRFVRKRIQDAQLGQLREVQGLSTLVVSSCGVIRTEQLRDVGNVDSLEHLDLSGTELDSSDFSWLVQFPRLKWLSFSGCSVDEKCLEPLLRLPLIEHLDLGHARMNDEAVQLLWSFPKLTTLILASSDVGDRAWRGMAECHSLCSIQLPNTHITDVGIETIVNQSELGSLPLRTLVLRNCQITDKSVVRLSSVESLRLLDLWGTAVTANGVAFMKENKPGCTVIVERLKGPS